MRIKAIKSELDSSVNFVFTSENNETYEARYVKRPGSDYFICYLSSHVGCNKACRFCHLTATGQTDMRELTPLEILDQAEAVVSYAVSIGYESAVNFNFMARGEPLASSRITDDFGTIRFILDSVANNHSIEYVRINISTIMPEESREIDFSQFKIPGVSIYYSMYSTDPAFRRKWMPKSIPPEEALRLIADLNVVIHGTYIADENDSYQDVWNCIDLVKSCIPNTRFNLVRFNSPNPKYKESEYIHEIQHAWGLEFPDSKIVDRVGYDVKASCGMFVLE